MGRKLCHITQINKNITSNLKTYACADEKTTLHSDAGYSCAFASSRALLAAYPNQKFSTCEFKNAIAQPYGPRNYCQRVANYFSNRFEKNNTEKFQKIDNAFKKELENWCHLYLLMIALIAVKCSFNFCRNYFLENPNEINPIFDSIQLGLILSTLFGIVYRACNIYSSPEEWKKVPKGTLRKMHDLFSETAAHALPDERKAVKANTI